MYINQSGAYNLITHEKNLDTNMVMDIIKNNVDTCDMYATNYFH